jgi:hypothetical protein
MRKTITITLTKDQYEAINGAIVARLDDGSFSSLALRRAWRVLETAWFKRPTKLVKDVRASCPCPPSRSTVHGLNPNRRAGAALRSFPRGR